MDIYYDEIKNSLIFQGVVDNNLLKIAQRIEIPLNNIEDLGFDLGLKKEYISKEFYYSSDKCKIVVFSNFGIRDFYYLEEGENKEIIWFKLKEGFFNYVVLKIDKEKLFLLLKKLYFVFKNRRNRKLQKKINEFLKIMENSLNKPVK